MLALELFLSVFLVNSKLFESSQCTSQIITQLSQLLIIALTHTHKLINRTIANMSRNNFCVHDSRVVVTPTRDIQEAHPLIPYQIPPGQLLDKDRRWISLQIWAEHVVPLRPRLERTGWWISQLCATTAAVAWILLQIWAEHVVHLRPRLERTGW